MNWILEAPNSGILQAATILMGYAYGSKMYQRFGDVVKNTFGVITIFYCIVFIIVLTCGNYMLMVFTATNPGKYRGAFVLIIVGYLFIPLNSTSLAMFQTMQKNLMAFFSALIRPILALLFSILGGFIARQTYEPLGYFAFSAVVGLATLLVHIPLNLKVGNQNKHLIKDQQIVFEVK